MGCDIHGYIEYKLFDTKEGAPYYGLFAEGVGERDYAMFGILANVRRDGCIYPVRGLPENVCMSITWEYCLFVTENGDGEGVTTKEKARQWVSQGFSKWVSKNQVTHPDWHNASWLNANEFEKCLQARAKIGEVDPTWNATLAALKALPESRFVFWFDN